MEVRWLVRVLCFSLLPHLIACLRSQATEMGTPIKKLDVQYEENDIVEGSQPLLPLPDTLQRRRSAEIVTKPASIVFHRIPFDTKSSDAPAKAVTPTVLPSAKELLENRPKKKSPPAAAITVLIIMVVSIKLVGVYLYGKRVLSRFNKKKRDRQRKALERLQHSQNELMQSYIAASMVKQKKLLEMPVIEEIEDDVPLSNSYKTLAGVDLNDNVNKIPGKCEADKMLSTSVKCSPQTLFVRRAEMWHSLDSLAHVSNMGSNPSEQILAKSKNRLHIGLVHKEQTNSAPNLGPWRPCSIATLSPKDSDLLMELPRISANHQYPKKSIDQTERQGSRPLGVRRGRLSAGNVNPNLLLAPTKPWLSCDNLGTRTRLLSPVSSPISDFPPKSARCRSKSLFSTLKLSSTRDIDKMQLLRFTEWLNKDCQEKQTQQLPNYHTISNEGMVRSKRLDRMSSPSMKRKEASESTQLPAVHKGSSEKLMVGKHDKGLLRCSSSDTMIALEVQHKVQSQRRKSPPLSSIRQLVSIDSWRSPFSSARRKYDTGCYTEV